MGPRHGSPAMLGISLVTALVSRDRMEKGNRLRGGCVAHAGVKPFDPCQSPGCRFTLIDRHLDDDVEGFTLSSSVGPRGGSVN